MKKTKQLMIKIVLLLLMVVGVRLIIHPIIADYWIAPNKIEEVNQQLMKGITSEGIKNNLEEARATSSGDVFDFSQVKSIDTGTIKPVIQKENVVGGIYIPSVNVNLPILYGATHENMLTATGTMKREQGMGEGNYALAGHNARNKDILFAPIRRMVVGDKIIITDKDKVYTYRMIRSEIVMPNRVDVIEDVPGEKLITLVSCYSDDGSDRIIVTGELVGSGDYLEADDTIKRAFNDL